ncbi:MAG TPA: EAL domain-containing protein [Allosphingosinicella sp.]|jgi:diguanylate cyclase (GGDEF)-like protein
MLEITGGRKRCANKEAWPSTISHPMLPAESVRSPGDIVDAEALFESILGASVDCIEILSMDGRLELMNGPGLYAMEIDDFDQIVGREWAALWPSGGRRVVRDAVRRARTGAAVRFSAPCPTAKGTLRWWDVIVTPIRDRRKRITRLLAISRDITVHRDTQERLRRIGEVDSLTDLPNRRSLQRRVEAAVACAMGKASTFGLLLLDLDRFKHVNDTFGHGAGDHLLRIVARRLRGLLKADAFLARMGGDEFAVIVPDVASDLDLIRLGEAILENLQRPACFDGRLIHASASIGGALFPDDGTSAHELLKNADRALHATKARGRGGIQMFQQHMRQQAQREASQLSLARVAIMEKSVLPFYQPKLCLASGRISGLEALLRWEHPRLGIQLPETIGEAFKDYELASRIGGLIQKAVIKDIRAWLRQGVEFGHVSINASPAEFMRDDYAERLVTRVEQAGICPSLIQIEVTEHAFLAQGAEHVERALRVLSANGILISLDDFGTGYSSLSHIKDFPVDILKIDRSFVSTIETVAESAAIVRALVELARNLSIEVVAEGVENEAQRRFLTGIGCGYGQGFLFSKPVKMEEVAELPRKVFGELGCPQYRASLPPRARSVANI